VKQIGKMAWMTIEDRIIFESYRQTLPIPILKDKRVFLVFIYYDSLDRPRIPSVYHIRNVFR